MRQIILDTETTGREVNEGHRIIEIGCLEMVDRRLTERYFHRYVNPQRESEAGALAVHGLTTEFLQDKPLFPMIAHDFIAFVEGAELIIHNAPFDLSFLDQELALCQKDYKKMTDYCRVLDTLPLARQLHPGQRNSLDALCKRYAIDLSKRERHGALIDVELLARVYLAMTGGQTSLFDGVHPIDLTVDYAKSVTDHTSNKVSDPFTELPILAATLEECHAHHHILKQLKEQSGRCLWSQE
ncbi:DNA polymerase III subunit epsilon [Rickettsiella massiliensis]|uniref:DNA polymerase III subunit epsilon n=1 Tax=Rickettsiella massiliensis TaxID=676517 RepID=UPI00029A1375|nr:DNA polymerase III subunit epsilon [Rickettsiella massiliensis]